MPTSPPFVPEADASPEVRAWFAGLHRLARYQARKYEIQYHQHEGEFYTAALEGAWKAACTFHQMGPGGGVDGPLRLGKDGLPVGLYSWGTLKIKGAVIDFARETMAQHGLGRKEESRHVTLSLDMPWDNDGERTFGETLPCGRSERYYEQIEEHAALLALKARMAAKDWDILSRRANGQSLRSIGEDVYGVTESRICQLMPGIAARARQILADMDAPAVEVPVLTAEEREDGRESVWLGMLAAEEASEAARLAKVRARYPVPGRGLAV